MGSDRSLDTCPSPGTPRVPTSPREGEVKNEYDMIVHLFRISFAAARTALMMF